VLDLKGRPVPQGRLKIGRDAILDNLRPSLRDYTRKFLVLTPSQAPAARSDPLQLPHSVFKNVISASLSLGLSPLKSSAASCASPS
jgi:hypothetical protein